MEVLDSTNTATKSNDGFGKVMRIAEIALLALTIVGITLKLLLLPFGSTFTLWGLLGLGSVYFPVGLVYAALSKRFTQSKDKALIAATCFMLGAGCVGILFSIQIWPMSRANVGMAAFLFVPLLVVSILALKGTIGVGQAAGRWALVRLVVIALPLWFFVFTSETQYYGMIGVLKDDPEFMELYRQCKEERNREACQQVNERHQEYREEMMRKEIESHMNR